VASTTYGRLSEVSHTPAVKFGQTTANNKRGERTVEGDSSSIDG